ncbi:TetR/AcrR family transcriptional regulator [Paenibacillus sp. N1-5-1-14]|uniref:TetR/AcrR family transcriptional regulator n=1 Tax=Paenibacillus radicibacter TaxID=2972488 RepID=UPI002159649D|nr:TetR/AcrR family transcriptional regulator [Paenibacillus radicibacter]MCR8645615.1 TetR/AcrR family transcriptional regulator [Paenibacillus radicibacter]
MARKAVAQELSRERILSGAKELFGAYGYRTLTMRSIAKSLGYSHGALYYHFTEKAELLYELILRDFNEMILRQRKMVTEAPHVNIDILRSVMLDFIQFGLSHRYHYEVIFMMNEEELTSYSKADQARYLELFSGIICEITWGTECVNSQFTLPWNIFMSLHGYIAYHIFYGQAFEQVQELAENHVNYLCGIVEMHQQQAPPLQFTS